MNALLQHGFCNDEFANQVQHIVDAFRINPQNIFRFCFALSCGTLLAICCVAWVFSFARISLCFCAVAMRRSTLVGWTAPPSSGLAAKTSATDARPLISS